MEASSHNHDEYLLEVRGLSMRYGQRLIQENLNFHIFPGEVFIIMGGSGCGKSTLLYHLIGLLRPYAGEILLDGQNLWEQDSEQRARLMRQLGFLYQKAGLWSSMTLAENIALPLREYSNYSESELRELCEFKLSLVGLAGFGHYYPAELSGGMQKRAGLARAIALDPKILFFDEPSAGLDPASAARLDDLILELRDSLKATIVVVTHELASIYEIADRAIFLDAESKTISASGNPKELRKTCTDPRVREFLTRAGKLEGF